MSSVRPEVVEIGRVKGEVRDPAVAFGRDRTTVAVAAGGSVRLVDLDGGQATDLAPPSATQACAVA